MSGLDIDHFNRRIAAMRLVYVRRQRARRRAIKDPTSFGLPDLLFPQEEGESDRDFRERRRDAIRALVDPANTIHLRARLEGKNEIIHLNEEMLRFIVDLTFGYVTRAIVWKPRGGGGTLAIAIVSWIRLVYRHQSFLLMGGSDDQASNSYNYMLGFFDCAPVMKKQLLKDDPSGSKLQLVTGALVKITGRSETKARGKHLPGFIGDEACQKDEQTEQAFQAALQGCLSEKENLIILNSTFHLPEGLFADYWDNAVEKGFTRYKWTIYDTINHCKEGLEDATEDDPHAMAFCWEKCPFSRVEDAETTDGGTMRASRGCHGIARHSDGWRDYDHLVSAKQINIGTDVYEVEHECNRPGMTSKAYHPKRVEMAFGTIDEDEIDATDQWAAGIDWGFSTMCAVVLSGRAPSRLIVPAGRFLRGQRTKVVIEILEEWRDQLYPGTSFKVYADSNNPMANEEVLAAGFDITPVSFQMVKDLVGVPNVRAYFNTGLLRIDHSLGILSEQLKNLKTNSLGKIVKKDDHGPDALMCALLEFMYTDEFGRRSQVK